MFGPCFQLSGQVCNVFSPQLHVAGMACVLAVRIGKLRFLNRRWFEVVIKLASIRRDAAGPLHSR